MAQFFLLIVGAVCGILADLCTYDQINLLLPIAPAAGRRPPGVYLVRYRQQFIENAHSRT